jgi:hypothetical protein
MVTCCTGASGGIDVSPHDGGGTFLGDLVKELGELWGCFLNVFFRVTRGGHSMGQGLNHGVYIFFTRAPQCFKFDVYTHKSCGSSCSQATFG